MARPTVLIEDFADMLGFDTPAPQEQAEPTALPVQGGLTEMNFSDMESFPNHKFKLYEGQRLADMADSIKQFGILLPIILWHTEDEEGLQLEQRENEMKQYKLYKKALYEALVEKTISKSDYTSFYNDYTLEHEQAEEQLKAIHNEIEVILNNKDENSVFIDSFKNTII